MFAHYLKSDPQPVWQFDQATTDQKRQLRYEDPSNRRYKLYTRGQVLVGRDQVIGKADLRLLELEHQAYIKGLNPRQVLLARLGVLAAVALVTVFFGVYVRKYYYRVIQNLGRCLAIAALMAALLLLTRLIELGGSSPHSPYSHVFAVVLIGSVLTIAYDQRLALAGAFVLTCLILMAVQGGLDLLLVLMACAAVYVFGLADIRSRSKIVKVAMGSALVGFAACWAVGLASYQQGQYILSNGLICAVMALVGGLAVQGVLPVIERLFRIATSMTLLEWSDPSKPLLRRLAIDAPGTFNHSMLLGTMAEAAAEAIGANGLLARVGAYYHDVGKINKPHYFVENQPDVNMTRHRNLSPAMSLLIIIGHVKDGLEIAKEYGLPRVLHQFIAEHHGTTVVEYFYHEATKQQSEDRPPISETEFRYPGSKPHSKETAILMLCDGVEGAVRSLSEPTAGRIEGIVHQIATKRLQDGQFDECDLTLRELHLIEASLTKSLCAIYHSRIAYPTTREAEPPASARAENGSSAEKRASAS